MQARASDAVTEWAFASGWRVVRWLPEAAAYRLFDVMADQLWKRRAGGVEQLEANLARVHPQASAEEIRILSRAGMRSYMRYYCEAFRLPKWSRSRITDTFIVDRHHIIDEAMAAGTGIILATAHMANWDHAGAWGGIRYGRVSSVAERLKPEGLFQRFLELRRSVGVEILGLGDPDVVATLAQRLEAGGLVAVLGDRDISRHGIEVDLFGERASFPAGPALLSVMTGAPLHPLTMWFTETGIAGRVHDRIDIPEHEDRQAQIAQMTQELATVLEQGIRENSVDWHMLQKVWIADLDSDRRHKNSDTL